MAAVQQLMQKLGYQRSTDAIKRIFYLVNYAHLCIIIVMRPKKTRWVKCDPSERCFKPKSGAGSEGIVLSLDEFEAIRLLDYEGFSQIQAAKQMRVHRSTVSRIATVARYKIAKALVQIKTLKIEGGCCKVIKGRLSNKN
jgi:predicted DNA-binding protein (UPF0251 family)